MKIAEYEYSEEVIMDNIIKPCRKGFFVYVICSSSNLYKKFKRFIKDNEYLTLKRGIFSRNGIVLFSINDHDYVHNYVDLIIKLR